MSDFPSTLIAPQKTVISALGSCSLIADMVILTSVTAGSATWPAANRALYVPIWIECEAAVTTFVLQIATQSGNLDVGIYDEKGNRIVSKGSTAVAAAGIQTVDLTTSVTGTASPVLAPGVYFLAMSCDNTTASFIRVAPSIQAEECCGVQQQALGSVTLGSTATFANAAAGYIPSIAIATVATV